MTKQPETYADFEALGLEASKKDPAKHVPDSVKRISARAQSGFNYGMSCELMATGHLKDGDLVSAALSSSVAIVRNTMGNVSDQGRATLLVLVLNAFGDLLSKEMAGTPVQPDVEAGFITAEGTGRA